MYKETGNRDDCRITGFVQGTTSGLHSSFFTIKQTRRQEWRVVAVFFRKSSIDDGKVGQEILLVSDVESLFDSYRLDGSGVRI